MPVVMTPWHCPPARLLPPLQRALLEPPAGEQPDADGGVPAHPGGLGAAAGGRPGLRQRAGRRHLQLLLLPLLPGARLPAHHDDAHQLVQVRAAWPGTAEPAGPGHTAPLLRLLTER